MSRSFDSELGRFAAAGALLVVAFLMTGTATSQGPNQSDINELRSTLQAQQLQIEKLRKVLEARRLGVANASSPDSDLPSQEERIKKLAETVFKEKEDQKKAEEAGKKAEAEAANACQGYQVGTDLKMTARWDPANGVRFETEHKDFSLHFGGYFQEDSVWWEQPGSTRAAQGGAGHGPLSGGLTPYEDGTFFRRVVFNMDGTCWEVVEFNLEYAFDNFGNNTGIGEVFEFFVGIKDMPYIGTVRVGSIKVPQGLEGDLTSSSKDLTFMERAAFSEAFYENFAPGIWMGNHVLCDRATWSASAYRQQGASSSGDSSMFQGALDGAAIMDGDWAYTGRLTALPCYCYDGRELIHLAVSATYRDALLPEAAGAATTTGGARFVDFSARPEMRDTVGNYTNVGPGNGKRMVDTGLIQCSDATILGTEFLTILGPLTIQSEWACSWADHVQKITSSTTGALVPYTANSLPFYGGYIQAAYLLTGENRLYDRRFGRLAPNGVRPHTPFWFVRNGDGHTCSGIGAWELAARWSYLDLNDGPVRGGILSSATFGLNWYLNNNVKIQFEYLNSERYSLPTGAIPGDINSFGIRTQILF